MENFERKNYLFGCVLKYVKIVVFFYCMLKCYKYWDVYYKFFFLYIILLVKLIINSK